MKHPGRNLYWRKERRKLSFSRIDFADLIDLRKIKMKGIIRLTPLAVFGNI